MLPNTLSAAWPDSQPTPPTTHAHSTAPNALMTAKRSAGTADVPIGLAFAMTLGFVVLCIAAIAMIFKTGWRLRG